MHEKEREKRKDKDIVFDDSVKGESGFYSEKTKRGR